MPLFVHHGGEPDHGDDGVEHEGEEEVFVECYPLTAQTPEGRETTHQAGGGSPEQEACELQDHSLKVKEDS